MGLDWPSEASCSEGDHIVKKKLKRTKVYSVPDFDANEHALEASFRRMTLAERPPVKTPADDRRRD